jgi:AmmeMemoRadiSam system protein B/AmmeMemoRadiSam system protein A
MKTMRFIYRLVPALFFVLIVIQCNSQSEKVKDQVCYDRNPVVSGSFYSNDSATLHEDLNSLFTKAEPSLNKESIVAILAPHAGYMYSGKVAASAYNQLDPEKKYDNIFIIASSHRALFQGASIYNQGDYITPLGKVKVNRVLANQFIDNFRVFTYNPDAHAAEHSLEVQLPFLQYILKKDFKIVPIVTGTQSVKEIELISKALLPYFNGNNLFVISTDFSHYPKYDDATRVDKKTGDAILANSVDKLITAVNENSVANVENLVTSLCGWPAVLTLLNITQNDHTIEVIPVDYQNSGDATGDKSRVVGYYAMAFVKNKKKTMIEDDFTLNNQEKKNLLDIARKTIHEYLSSGTYPDIDESVITQNMKSGCVAFVTLHKAGELRGCIGRFVADDPLYQIVQKMAVAAATQDHRFPMVTKDEMDKIDIEISVLTPLKRIESIDEIVMGKHGIYIKKGFATGTFLPQVATETGWTKEEFLGYCARNNAGIGWDGWKDAEIYTYEALVFGENEIK